MVSTEDKKHLASLKSDSIIPVRPSQEFPPNCKSPDSTSQILDISKDYFIEVSYDGKSAPKIKSNNLNNSIVKKKKKRIVESQSTNISVIVQIDQIEKATRKKRRSLKNSDNAPAINSVKSSVGDLKKINITPTDFQGDFDQVKTKDLTESDNSAVKYTKKNERNHVSLAEFEKRSPNKSLAQSETVISTDPTYSHSCEKNSSDGSSSQETKLNEFNKEFVSTVLKDAVRSIQADNSLFEPSIHYRPSHPKETYASRQLSDSQITEFDFRLNTDSHMSWNPMPIKDNVSFQKLFPQQLEEFIIRNQDFDDTRIFSNTDLMSLFEKILMYNLLFESFNRYEWQKSISDDESHLDEIVRHQNFLYFLILNCAKETLKHNQTLSIGESQKIDWSKTLPITEIQKMFDEVDIQNYEKFFQVDAIRFSELLYILNPSQLVQDLSADSAMDHIKCFMEIVFKSLVNSIVQKTNMSTIHDYDVNTGRLQGNMDSLLKEINLNLKDIDEQPVKMMETKNQQYHNLLKHFIEQLSNIFVESIFINLKTILESRRQECLKILRANLGKIEKIPADTEAFKDLSDLKRTEKLAALFDIFVKIVTKNVENKISKELDRAVFHHDNETIERENLISEKNPNVASDHVSMMHFDNYDSKGTKPTTSPGNHCRCVHEQNFRFNGFQISQQIYPTTASGSINHDSNCIYKNTGSYDTKRTNKSRSFTEDVTEKTFPRHKNEIISEIIRIFNDNISYDDRKSHEELLEMLESLKEDPKDDHFRDLIQVLLSKINQNMKLD